MAFRNPKLFGLNVLSNLADVVDKDATLNALNLPPNDLNVIRGSADNGATIGDWISFSRLTQPIYKTLDRYYRDASVYTEIFNSKASVDSILFGNLSINGSLSGQAIRYRYVSGTGPTATIRIADISTSRVSAWSATTVPSTSTSPIFYGARVGIITGGQLQFGTPTTSGQIRLQTSTTPETKEFASEFPTHKINCTIGGRTVSLYAMKGIPIVFKGIFRSLNATITLTSLISGIQPSWKIVETNNTSSFTKYANRGTTTSTVNYRSTITRERNIQFYYNPDNIATITINSANISTIPESVFQNLSKLNLSYNNLKNFPNLNFIAPNIQALYIGNNPFYLSETPEERRFDNILSKIPTGLTELSLASTFFGSLNENSIANRFPGLTILDLGRPSNSTVSAYFYPDSVNSSGYIPNVPETCQSYSVSSNDFRAIGISSGSAKNVKELDNLISLNLSSNYYLSDPNFSISASNNKIKSVYIDSTNLPIPNLAGKQTLEVFSAAYGRNVGFLTTTSGTYKFEGCGSLTSLNFYGSAVKGAIPKFTNPNLTFLSLYGTQLTGGGSDGDTTYVIPEKTFEQCSKLDYFAFLSSYALPNTPIHPSVFEYTPNLRTLYYISYGRTTGDIPKLSACSKLINLIVYYNGFTGNAPSLSTSPSIYYVYLPYNRLSGTIPGYRNLTNLSYLYLNNNQFTGLSKFTNLPNLLYFYANNNQIAGEIPDFTECPNITYIILYSNQLTNYQSGAFAKLYSLRYLDLSSNQLTQQAVNSIVDDLYTNYESVNRGNVTVNLKNNEIPSETAIEKINFLLAKGWSILYG